MSIEKLNKRKAPIVVIDDSLNQLKDTVLFPEKLAKANATLKRIGVPKIQGK